MSEYSATASNSEHPVFGNVRKVFRVPSQRRRVVSGAHAQLIQHQAVVGCPAQFRKRALHAVPRINEDVAETARSAHLGSLAASLWRCRRGHGYCRYELSPVHDGLHGVGVGVTGSPATGVAAHSASLVVPVRSTPLTLMRIISLSPTFQGCSHTPQLSVCEPSVSVTTKASQSPDAETLSRPTQ